MIIRRRKSRAAKVADALKLYAVAKTAKGASKTAKGATKVAKGTAAYKFVTGSPFGKAIPIAAGAGVAALVAVKALRGGHGEPASA